MNNVIKNLMNTIFNPVQYSNTDSTSTIFECLISFFDKRTNMEKEIFEQPYIINKLIKKYIDKNKSIMINIPDNIKRIALIASGSSYHSAAIAADYLRVNVHCDAQSYYASEIALEGTMDVEPETLYIFISQSGETYDTNKALEIIKAKTSKTLSITNTKNSTLYNNTKYKVLTFAGIEKSIASTKSMCAQIYCLFLIAAKIMQQKDIPVESLIKELVLVPECIKKAYSKREEICNFAKCIITYENAAILASGMFYPLAKEGALKIKETSYINTTAYPVGEFLHGHIAILNKKCAVITIINNHNAEFTMNILNKIRKNYNTDSLIISAIEMNVCDRDTIISTLAIGEIDFMFNTLIIMQLLAFESALLLKRNIDKPLGLSKIVK